MITKILTEAADNFFQIKQETIQKLTLECQCNNPGYSSQCAGCPYYADVINEINLNMNNETFFIYKDVYIESCFKNDTTFKYKKLEQHTQEIQDKCIDLYIELKNANAVERIMNVPSTNILRWAKEKGISIFNSYEAKRWSPEIKEKCVNLYKQYNNAEEVSRQLNVSSNSVRRWVNIYESQGTLLKTDQCSEDIKKQAIELYLETKSIVGVLRKINKNDRVVTSRVLKKWLKEEGVEIYKHSYSQEVKDKCIKLYEQLQSSVEVSKILGVPRTSIKKWVDEAKSI